jgi:hypothetical protein
MGRGLVDQLDGEAGSDVGHRRDQEHQGDRSHNPAEADAGHGHSLPRRAADMGAYEAALRMTHSTTSAASSGSSMWSAVASWIANRFTPLSRCLYGPIT